jgi:hypothetical protein
MGLFPKNLREYVALAGIPQTKLSKIFIVDTEQGSDSNPGTNFEQPLASVAAAYALCTADRHDTVLFVARDTADYPTAAITWAKDHTHLIGLSGNLPGMGQRCRVVNHADNDLAVLFTLSGNGCIVKNMQFFDGKNSAADGACVLVSGERNYFKNVFVAGMGDATALGPATRAGSYSLKVSGSENYFEDCTIGLDTIVRSAANAELIVSGVRNRFKHCDIRSNSVTAGKFLVKIDNTGGDMRDIIFDDCLFFNYTTNWVNGIDNVFDMPAGGSTHYVILRGNCQLVGVNSGWADTVTRVYGAGPAPNAGFGISTNPTT